MKFSADDNSNSTASRDSAALRSINHSSGNSSSLGFAVGLPNSLHTLKPRRRMGTPLLIADTMNITNEFSDVAVNVRKLRPGEVANVGNRFVPL